MDQTVLKRLENIEKRHGELEALLADPKVMQNQTEYQKLAKEMSDIKETAEAFVRFKKVKSELEDIEQMMEEKSSDREIMELYREEVASLSKKKKDLEERIESLLLEREDPFRNKPIIVEIRAGTGGEEAALFAADLFRMYCRYAAEHKLKVDVFSTNATGIGGLKEVIFGVSGPHTYKLFKYESGIHRVQRVPETETGGRIHTSAVTVAVLPEADEVEISLDPADLRIDVFCASGPGGQHVNKTASAVRITHIPSGLVVSCQDEKSQHKNKAKALKVLRARLFEKKEREEAARRSAERKTQVGSGDRSGKIRTYNFPERRVTDHRIGLTLHSLGDILEGHMDELVDELEKEDRALRLSGKEGL